ncbi:hypothetical protein ACJX0J_039066, partial [Zea mays]
MIKIKACSIIFGKSLWQRRYSPWYKIKPFSLVFYDRFIQSFHATSYYTWFAHHNYFCHHKGKLNIYGFFCQVTIIFQSLLMIGLFIYDTVNCQKKLAVECVDPFLKW